MFDHPQVVAEEMVSRVEHPVLGHYRGLTRSIKFGRTPGPEPFSAPTPGQHSAELLADLGYEEEETRRLVESGAVR